MTEDEWNSSTADPQGMLKFLRDRATDRKARLFAVACCRRIWHLLIDEKSRRAVQAAEWFADGQISKKEVQAAFDEARPPVEAERKNPAYTSPCGAIGGPALAAYAAAFQGLGRFGAADGAAGGSVRAVSASGGDEETEKTGQADLLRDIFGNPFRPLPALPPSVRTWNDRTVEKLALAAYDDRHLPSGHLHPHRLAILADALEDAGCEDAELLGHLRSGGPHVRGCFAVDRILSRE